MWQLPDGYRDPREGGGGGVGRKGGVGKEAVIGPQAGGTCRAGRRGKERQAFSWVGSRV